MSFTKLIPFVAVNVSLLCLIWIVCYQYRDALYTFPSDVLKAHNEVWYGKSAIEEPVLDQENPSVEGYEKLSNYQRSLTPEFSEGDKRCYMVPKTNVYGGLAFLTYVVATKEEPCFFLTEEHNTENGKMYVGSCLIRMGKSAYNFAKPGDCLIVD